MMKEKVKEFISMQMGIFIKENFLMANSTEMAFLNGQMEMFMEVNLKIIKKKAKGP